MSVFIFGKKVCKVYNVNIQPIPTIEEGVNDPAIFKAVFLAGVGLVNHSS